MTDTTILDKAGNPRFRVLRRPDPREGFSIGSETFPDDFAPIRAAQDADLQRQRGRAALNKALLSQRPIHGGKGLPVAMEPEDLEIVERMLADPEIRHGKTDVSISMKSGRWEADEIFARQPHAAWMRYVDEVISARRGLAAVALRNYWRLICLEMPSLGPDRDARVSIRMPKTISSLPVLIIDDVVFHAQQIPVAQLIEMSLKHGGRGFVSVGPAAMGAEGSVQFSLVGLTAPSRQVLAACLQPERVASLI